MGSLPFAFIRLQSFLVSKITIQITLQSVQCVNFTVLGRSISYEGLFRMWFSMRQLKLSGVPFSVVDFHNSKAFIMKVIVIKL